MKISQTVDYEIIAKLNRHVQNLHHVLYPEYFKPYNYLEVREVFQGLIHDQNFVFLLLEDHEEALGYVWLELRNYPENPFIKGYQSVYVHQIGLREDQKKMGYGTKLMDEVYDIAKRNDIDLVELDYWLDNSDAKEFYKKQGFTKYREVVHKRL